MGYLVSEAAVVGVLHDGHQLDRVVAERGDPGQHVLTETAVYGSGPRRPNTIQRKA